MAPLFLAPTMPPHESGVFIPGSVVTHELCGSAEIDCEAE